MGFDLLLVLLFPDFTFTETPAILERKYMVKIFCPLKAIIQAMIDLIFLVIFYFLLVIKIKLRSIKLVSSSTRHPHCIWYDYDEKYPKMETVVK